MKKTAWKFEAYYANILSVHLCPDGSFSHFGNNQVYEVFAKPLDCSTLKVRSLLLSLIATYCADTEETMNKFLSCKKISLEEYVFYVSNIEYKADELAIYLLSLMTSTHIIIHHCGNSYWRTCTTYQHLNSEGIHHIHLLYLGDQHFMQMMGRFFPNPIPPPVILNGLDNDNEVKAYNDNFISASDFVKRWHYPHLLLIIMTHHFCHHLIFYLDQAF